MDENKYDFELTIQIEIKKIEKLFENTIDEFLNGKISKSDFLGLIYNFTERLTSYYAFLNNKILEQLDNILFNIFDFDNFIEIDEILYIIVNLGLQNCYDRIKRSLFEIKNSNVRVNNFLNYLDAEIGSDISNPYKSLGINK